MSRARILGLVFVAVVLLGSGAAFLLSRSAAPPPPEPFTEPPRVLNVQLLDLPQGDAHLSPDGSRIALVREGLLTMFSAAGEELYSLELKQIDRSSVRWSPDATTMVMALGRPTRDIWLLDVESSQLSNLTGPGKPTPADDIEPCWLDSGTLAFLREQQAGASQALYTLSLGNADPRHIAAISEYRRHICSPDGQHVVLTTRQQGAGGGLKHWLFALDQSEPLFLATTYQTLPASLSADGRFLSLGFKRFMADGFRQVLQEIVQLGDEHLMRADADNHAGWLGWAPAGDSLIYTPEPKLGQRVDGLFWAARPGAPGVEIYFRRVEPPIDYGIGGVQVITWARNNSVLLREYDDILQKPMFVLISMGR